MKLKDAKRYLKELKDAHPIQSLTVHGGEPFLYFERLKQIFREAKKLEIPRRGVITNSYWAKTKAIAKRKLAELKKAGLTRITLSVDGFHQEYIPVQNVKNSVEAAVNVGFEKIWVDSYFLTSNSDSDNPYDISTKKVLENLDILDNVEFSEYQPRFVGRAAELAKYVKPKAEVLNGKCQLPFWIGGDLRNPETIEIDFEGNVMLCPGISIGNARKQSLTQVLHNYDLLEHPILSVIEKEGPIGLLRIATRKGFKQKQKYVDKCHLCYITRRFLRRYYAQYLTPADCY